MEIPRHWRLKDIRYSLQGEECGECHTKIFPPRDICPTCNVEAKKSFKMSGKGEIYSFTTLYDAPEGFENQSPYSIALIKLEEGPMVAAQLTDVDNDKVEIGMKVEMVTRKLKDDGDKKGIIVYGYKFRPVLEFEKK